MLNLIRSDLYRLAHGKMAYVALAILVAYFGMTAYSNFQSSQPEGIAQMEQDLAQLKQEDAGPENIVQMEQTIHAFKTRTFDGGYTDADSVGIAPGGLLGAILCVLTALLCYQDFSAGFAKSQLSALAVHQMRGRCAPAGRAAYYTARLAAIAVIDAMLLIITVTLGIVSNAVLGFTVSNPEPIWQVTVWMLLTWLLLCGYTFSTAAACWTLRSSAAGVIISLLTGSQALESLLMVALSSMARAADSAALFSLTATIGEWLPTTSTNILLNGASALFGGTGDTAWADAIQALATTAHPLTHVLIAGLVFCTVASVLAVAIARRRDVA